MKRANKIEASALAKIFSASVVKELANSGASPAFARLIREAGLAVDRSMAEKVSVLFDEAYSLLVRRENRSEYVYKSALTHKILLGRHSLRTASMAAEFRVGKCKADLVIFNGTASVYEIKSERDSLIRLPNQLEEYSRVFAKVSVIVGENHLDSVVRLVPKHVGISTLSHRNQVTTVREALDNANSTDPLAIFNAISQREAGMILRLNGKQVPDVPNTKRYRALEAQFVKLEPEIAHCGMVKVLKKTRDLQTLQGLLLEVPKSLYTATLTAKLTGKQRVRLVNALQTPLNSAINWG